MPTTSPTEPNPAGGWVARHRSALLWVGGMVVLVLVLVAVLVRTATDGTDQEALGSTASPRPSASAGSSPSATPGGSTAPAASPSASASASAEPTTTPSAEPGADDGSGVVVRPTAAPVPIDEPAAPAPQVVAELGTIEAVQGEANIPGEVGGPSLRVTVVVDNGTATDLDLTSAVVNLYFGPERTPAIDLLEPGRVDFPASVAAGAEASGTFVFLVPVEERDDVTIEFDLSSEATVVLFTGAVAA